MINPIMVTSMELLLIFIMGEKLFYKHWLLSTLIQNTLQNKILFSLTLKELAKENSNFFFSLCWCFTHTQADIFNNRKEGFFLVHPWLFYMFWPAKKLITNSFFTTCKAHIFTY